jgi:glucosamine-6-phosphate deaminase
VRASLLRDADAVAVAAADLIAQRARADPGLVLALPTGRTPVRVYAELQRRHQAGALDLSRARGFNLDELVMKPADARSFHSYMELHAWQRIGLLRERCDIPDGGAPELEAECLRYERAIAAAGGIDLAILGVGADGHVAYNMPGTITLPTHVVRLPDGLADSFGVEPAARPLRALTMGLGTIRGAREILLLATGETKAAAIAALERGLLDPQWPCTYLAPHAALTVLLDGPAASRRA